MECRYCQASNAEDDHRCRRCGRRLRMTPIYAAASAAAPELFESSEAGPVPGHNGRSGVSTEPPPPPKPITYQPSLFTSRELPRVVPFESIAPGSVEAPPKKAVSTKPRTRQRRTILGQQSLDLSGARYARPSEGVILCDAPVAPLSDRAIAAALDAGIILFALSLFGLIFQAAGIISHITVPAMLTARTVPGFVVVAAVLVIFYKLLWCLAGGDTPGMKWTHLMLVNFDGQTPNRKQRLIRLAASILSVLAAGLGLFWALVDEETLTWHDHISKTFPTPC